MTAVLQMRGITKSFGPVQALRGVDFDVQRGEVRGLLGGNGAGKTTLMNVLYGLYTADAGAIEVDSTPVTIRSPRDAMDVGVGMVHQTFLQVDSFSVAENVALASARGVGRQNLGPLKERIRELSESLGLHVEPDAIVGELPVGVRQRVEIIKALMSGAKLLVLDEPTTNLTPQEVDVLFAAIRKIVDDGVSVVLITHKIRETMAICDRLTVMRDGKVVGQYERREISAEQLAGILAGDAVDGAEAAVVLDPRTRLDLSSVGGDVAEPRVVVSGLCADGDFKASLIADIDIKVAPGRVFGIAGVAGNGQVELAETLAGARAATSGSVVIDGINLTGQPTARWLDAGVVYVPEDRYRDGLLPGGSITENLLLGRERDSGRLIDWRALRAQARQTIRDFAIRTPNEHAMAGQLSGGNIQRVILARAFERDPKLLILHSPTRGLDIASTQFVYDQIRAATERGCCVVVLSEDLDELLAIAPTIAVIYNGKIVGTRDGKRIDPYELGVLMTGLEAAS